MNRRAIGFVLLIAIVSSPVRGQGQTVGQAEGQTARAPESITIVLHDGPQAPRELEALADAIVWTESLEAAGIDRDLIVDCLDAVSKDWSSWRGCIYRLFPPNFVRFSTPPDGLQVDIRVSDVVLVKPLTAGTTELTLTSGTTIIVNGSAEDVREMLGLV